MSRQNRGISECRNSDTPRKSDLMQAFFGNGFALPEISLPPAGCPQPERRNHAYIQRLAEPTAPVFRDGIGGLRRAPLPSLCANDDETKTCREFTLEGIGQTSSGYAPNQRQQDPCSSRR